jgi:hypothetical protein
MDVLFDLDKKPMKAMPNVRIKCITGYKNNYHSEYIKLISTMKYHEKK